MFAAVASPVRRALLEALLAGPRSVQELAAGLPISRPAVSRHLGVLRGAGLVLADGFGPGRRYQLDPGPLRQVRAWVRLFPAAEGTAMTQDQQPVPDGPGPVLADPAAGETGAGQEPGGGAGTAHPPGERQAQENQDNESPA